MKGLPYSEATAGDRALQECQRVLEGFGCQSFATGIDNERQVVVVSFAWRGKRVQMEASWRGYAALWLKQNPWNSRRFGSRADYDKKALGIGRTAVCSVLRDWVKAQTVAIECGILQFEEVFMPHMLLNDGRRFIDAAKAHGMLAQIGLDPQ